MLAVVESRNQARPDTRDTVSPRSAVRLADRGTAKRRAGDFSAILERLSKSVLALIPVVVLADGGGDTKALSRRAEAPAEQPS